MPHKGVIKNVRKRTKEKSIFKPWSQAEFAKLTERDPAVISRLIKRGILARGADCNTWIAEAISHYAEMAAGRTAENLNLADERAKLARAQAAKISFDLARARKEFRSRESIAHELSSMFATIRTKLLALAPTIQNEHRLPKTVFASIELRIRDALYELASAKLPADIAALIEEIDNEAFQRATETPEAAIKKSGAGVPIKISKNRSKVDE